MHYFGKAILIRKLGLRSRWHPGSALYLVDPPIEVNHFGTLKNCRFVIVAITPKVQVTFDPFNQEYWNEKNWKEDKNVGKPETAIFAARANGRVFTREWDLDSQKWIDGSIEKGTYNCLGVYVPGNNHQKALNKLQGGYKIVEKL